MADGRTFERNLGSDGSHGINFEWETTLLTYLRCEKLHQDWKKNNNTGVKSFFVANNVKGVGAFDDVVVRVEYVEQGEVRTKLLLSQCKHVMDAKKLDRFQSYLGPKEIQKYFDSFFKVYAIFKDKISDCDEINMTCVSKKQKEEIETKCTLKSFFDCTFDDFEFIFLSNIEAVPRNNPSFSRVESTAISEFTRNLFCGTEILNNEYCLNDEWCFENLKCEDVFSENRKIIIHKFCKQFRIFLRQEGNLDILINTAIKECFNQEIDDNDILRAAMLEELKLIFDSKYSPTMTEKTELLKTIIGFLELKKSSDDILKYFRRHLKLSSQDQADLSLQPPFHIKCQGQFFKIEKLKIFRTFIELCKEYLCLILKNEDDGEKQELARKLRIYIQATKVYVLIDRNLKLKVEPIENEIFVQISNTSMDQTCSETWVHQVTSETQNIIESSIVNIQGYKSSLGTFCSNWRDILDEENGCKILESRQVEIGSILPAKHECYIDRRFKMKELSAKLYSKLERLITRDGKHRVMLFFLKDKKSNDLDYECKIFDSLGEVRKFKSKVQNEEKTFYCFTYFNEKIEFRYIFGKECEIFEDNIVDEEYLSNIHVTKFTILNDVAGMGKSTTMLALAIMYKENSNSHFVHFIELNKHACDIDNVEIIHTPKEAVHFVATKLLNFEAIEYELFVNACIVTGKVALFFDAYDELSVVKQKFISALLLILEGTKIARIFVSSRPKSANELENEILVQPVQFLELLSEERERCLFEFWRKMLKCNETHEGKLKLIVNKIIRSLEPKENLMNELLAIPLQIKMISRAYYNTMNQVLNNERDINSIDIDLLNLYDKFIRSHAEHYLEVKFAGNWINWDTDKKNWEIQEKLRDTKVLACSVVVPELEIQIKERDLALKVLHDDLGLITNMDPPVFIHRTIAESLAANYIVTELFSNPTDKKVAKIFKLILSDSKFDVLRKFINSIFLVTGYPKYFVSKGIRFNFVMKWISRETPLHISAFEGNIELLKAILQRDSTLVNVKNSLGRTAFHNACSNGKVEAVNILLLTYKCIVNTVDLDGNTPLHDASRKGLAEIMKPILLNDISAVENNPPIANAIQGKLPLPKNYEWNFKSINKQNNNGETSLHLAIQSHNVEAVKLLLDTTFCDTKIQDNNGKNIFHFAARDGSMEIMQLLLENVASLHIDDDINVNTFLHPAISKLSSNAVIFPIDQKCSQRWTPLLYACSRGHSNIVDILLKHKCSVNERDRHGDTALHVAARGGHDKIVEALLNYETTMKNVTNGGGVTTLYLACLFGHSSVLEVLIKHKCSVNERDKNGDTALHIAARRGHDKIIEALLNYDTSIINVTNEGEETALYLACLFGYSSVLEVLIKHKCSVNERDKNGDTALHIAARRGRDKIIEALLNYETTMINVTNTSGHTALYLACLFGHPSALEVLIKHKLHKLRSAW